ncbi:hypothetical protein [Microbacterium sp. P04]|uniref:hypothetical protein n=1 Tax=Microbacterium sp. P04 TaxID=3366947 RepID=UPI0037453126
MSDIDRVWMASHHPSVSGDLLNDAAHLPPDKAAGLLLKHIPQPRPVSLGERLDCIGIALGTLSPTIAERGDARSVWRSTLPVLLVSEHPRRNAPLAREIAEQVGYLVYGSTAGPSSHRQVSAFADEFEHAFKGV